METFVSSHFVGLSFEANLDASLYVIVRGGEGWEVNCSIAFVEVKKSLQTLNAETATKPIRTLFIILRQHSKKSFF
jgi:hypothetical protein